MAKTNAFPFAHQMVNVRPMKPGKHRFGRRGQDGH